MADRAASPAAAVLVVCAAAAVLVVGTAADADGKACSRRSRVWRRSMKTQ